MENKSILLWLPKESTKSIDFPPIKINYSELDFLPFLLFSNEAEKFKKTGSASIRSVNLLFGIVYGFNEIKKVLTNTSVLKKILLEILDQFFQDSTSESLELMLLDMSVVVRSELGLNAYSKFLNSCSLIVPNSSMIKRDQLIVKWTKMTIDPSKKLFTEIIELYHQIDLSELNKTGQTVITMYYIFSLIFTKNKEKAISALNESKMFIKDKFLLNLIGDLIRTPDEFHVKDLMITTENIQKWKLQYSNNS